MNKQGDFQCSCCEYYTLSEANGSYEICPVCYWEDDEVQDSNPAYAGGANVICLNMAKQNFMAFGACEERFKQYVREPNEHDRL